MFPLPITMWISIGSVVLAVLGLGYGKYEHSRYETYVAKAESAAKEQEMINHYKAKEAAQVNEKVKNDYESKLAIIKRTYAGMRLSSSGETGTISNTTSPTDGTATDPKFIEKCAMTTLQLVSLQAWLNEQIGIFNGK